MNILVIGGTGFIGAHAVRALSVAGHRVAVFHRGATRAELPGGVEEIVGDHAALADHGAAIGRFAPEVVLHTVAMTDADARRVVDALAGRTRRIVVLSSMDVYRARNRLFRLEPGPPEPGLLTERSPLRRVLYPYRAMTPGPEHPLYDYEKVAVERALAQDERLSATILRLPITYGPGDKYHRVAEYLRRMDDRRRAIPLTAGRARWRCTRGYVENVAHAIALAVGDDAGAGEIYNAGDEPPLSEAEWVRAIAAAAGWDGEVVEVPDGSLPDPTGVPLDWRHHWAADTSKLREQLGFAEPVPPDEAMRRSVAWERANPAPSPPPVDYEAEDAALALVR